MALLSPHGCLDVAAALFDLPACQAGAPVMAQSQPGDDQTCLIGTLVCVLRLESAAVLRIRLVVGRAASHQRATMPVLLLEIGA